MGYGAGLGATTTCDLTSSKEAFQAFNHTPACYKLSIVKTPPTPVLLEAANVRNLSIVKAAPNFTVKEFKILAYSEGAIAHILQRPSRDTGLVLRITSVKDIFF